MTLVDPSIPGIEFAAGLARPLFLGMVHLRALPGAPGFDGNFEDGLKFAVDDLTALVEGGADGAILENFFDVPFYPDRVPPVTVAAMTAAAGLMRVHIPEDFILGLNVLRNDARASLSIAAVVGASFIRVNVHAGVSVADQGFLAGRAHESVRLRRELGAHVAILADVGVKHASSIGSRSLTDEAKDLVERGLADGLLLTGPRTGVPVDAEDLVSVRSAVPRAVLLAASGVDLHSVGSVAKHCDGVIVGTWLKRGGRIEAPIDRDRVKQLSIELRRSRS